MNRRRTGGKFHAGDVRKRLWATRQSVGTRRTRRSAPPSALEAADRAGAGAAGSDCLASFRRRGGEPDGMGLTRARQIVLAVIGALWLLLVVWLTLKPFLAWRSTHFVITDRRVMYRHGLFTRWNRHPLAHQQRRVPPRCARPDGAQQDHRDQSRPHGTPLEFDDVPQVESNCVRASAVPRGVRRVRRRLSVSVRRRWASLDTGAAAPPRVPRRRRLMPDLVGETCSGGTPPRNQALCSPSGCLGATIPRTKSNRLESVNG